VGVPPENSILPRFLRIPSDPLHLMPACRRLFARSSWRFRACSGAPPCRFPRSAVFTTDMNGARHDAGRGRDSREGHTTRGLRRRSRCRPTRGRLAQRSR
jgi:hypothetical protein